VGTGRARYVDLLIRAASNTPGPGWEGDVESCLSVNQGPASSPGTTRTGSLLALALSDLSARQRTKTKKRRRDSLISRFDDPFSTTTGRLRSFSSIPINFREASTHNNWIARLGWGWFVRWARGEQFCTEGLDCRSSCERRKLRILTVSSVSSFRSTTTMASTNVGEDVRPPSSLARSFVRWEEAPQRGSNGPS
jgi:hypothetical protein